MENLKGKRKERKIELRRKMNKKGKKEKKERKFHKEKRKVKDLGFLKMGKAAGISNNIARAEMKIQTKFSKESSEVSQQLPVFRCCCCCCRCGGAGCYRFYRTPIRSLRQRKAIFRD